MQVGANTERAHRQIIDSIRQKDLNSLVDAIEGNVVGIRNFWKNKLLFKYLKRICKNEKFN